MAHYTPPPHPLLRLRQAAVELAVILLFGLLYIAALFSADSLALQGLHPDMRLRGVEHERLSGILVPIEIGLGLSERAPGIGHLPAWNPYLGTGTPLLNNAFLYLYNPFMSLPVLALGAVQGGKIAIMLGFLLAAVNMWALAKAIGLARLARVTTALLYMISGGIIGKFLSGHFQLGLSLVWLPLVFAGLWWTLHTRHRAAPVLMAVAFALLFFSGNIYYSLHALVCCAVIALVYAIGQKLRHLLPATAAETTPETARPLRQRISGLLRAVVHPGPALWRAAAGGLMALGLSMILFLPVWAVRDHVSHEQVEFDPRTGEIASQYSLGTSLANLTLPWEAWLELEGEQLELLAAVDYAYIGPGVFLLIGGLALVGIGQHRKTAFIALLLAVGMMIWGAGQTVIVKELYWRIPLLAEFRYVGRAHAVAGLWWIVLAGIALDNLWRAIPKTALSRDHLRRIVRVLAIVLLIWAWFLFYSSANNATRMTMVLENFQLFNQLNDLRFATYPQAIGALVGLVVVALLLDTLLIPLGVWLRRRAAFSVRGLLDILGERLARLALVLLALVSVVDVLHVNSEVMDYGPPGNNFGRLYAATFGTLMDTTPFPSILEPYGPSAYDAYYSRVRTWGLNEGWTPLPVRGDLIPNNAPKLLHLPGWAIVSTEYQRGGTYELARDFVEIHDGVQVQCAARTVDTGGDPCDIESHDGSILYALPQALPYAFVASGHLLGSPEDAITQDNVRPVQALRHQMDTIEIRAAAPDAIERYYLIVQETHFPGWQASVDGEPASTVTVGAHLPGGPSAGFIGVPMQPGTHAYVLRYEPPGFAAGALISGLTLVAMAVYLSGVRLRRPRFLRRASPTPAPDAPES